VLKRELRLQTMVVKRTATRKDIDVISSHPTERVIIVRK